MWITYSCDGADGLIGIGIATTAVGLLVGGIAAAVARKK
jgi:fission 1 protein